MTAYEFRCPFGLVFDERKLACDWPWLVGGCGSGAGTYLASSGIHTSTFVNGGNLEESLGKYGAGYNGNTANGFGRGFGFGSLNKGGSGGVYQGSSTAGAGYIASQFDDHSNRRPFGSFPDYEISGGRIPNTGGVVLGENFNVVGGSRGNLGGSSLAGNSFGERNHGRGQGNSNIAALYNRGSATYGLNPAVSFVQSDLGKGITQDFIRQYPTTTSKPFLVHVPSIQINDGTGAGYSGGLSSTTPKSTVSGIPTAGSFNIDQAGYGQVFSTAQSTTGFSNSVTPSTVLSEGAGQNLAAGGVQLTSSAGSYGVPVTTPNGVYQNSGLSGSVHQIESEGVKFGALNSLGSGVPVTTPSGINGEQSLNAVHLGYGSRFGAESTQLGAAVGSYGVGVKENYFGKTLPIGISNSGASEGFGGVGTSSSGATQIFNSAPISGVYGDSVPGSEKVLHSDQKFRIFTQRVPAGGASAYENADSAAANFQNSGVSQIHEHISSGVGSSDSSSFVGNYEVPVTPSAVTVQSHGQLNSAEGSSTVGVHFPTSGASLGVSTVTPSYNIHLTKQSTLDQTEAGGVSLLPQSKVVQQISTIENSALNLPGSTFSVATVTPETHSYRFGESGYTGGYSVKEPTASDNLDFKAQSLGSISTSNGVKVNNNNEVTAVPVTFSTTSAPIFNDIDNTNQVSNTQSSNFKAASEGLKVPFEGLQQTLAYGGNYGSNFGISTVTPQVFGNEKTEFSGNSEQNSYTKSFSYSGQNNFNSYPSDLSKVTFNAQKVNFNFPSQHSQSNEVSSAGVYGVFHSQGKNIISPALSGSSSSEQYPTSYANSNQNAYSSSLENSNIKFQRPIVPISTFSSTNSGYVSTPKPVVSTYFTGNSEASVTPIVPVTSSTPVTYEIHQPKSHPQGVSFIQKTLQSGSYGQVSPNLGLKNFITQVSTPVSVPQETVSSTYSPAELGYKQVYLTNNIENEVRFFEHKPAVPYEQQQNLEDSPTPKYEGNYQKGLVGVTANVHQPQITTYKGTFVHSGNNPVLYNPQPLKPIRVIGNVPSTYKPIQNNLNVNHQLPVAVSTIAPGVREEHTNDFLQGVYGNRFSFSSAASPNTNLYQSTSSYQSSSLTPNSDDNQSKNSILLKNEQNAFPFYKQSLSSQSQTSVNGVTAGVNQEQQIVQDQAQFNAPGFYGVTSTPTPNTPESTVDYSTPQTLTNTGTYFGTANNEPSVVSIGGGSQGTRILTDYNRVKTPVKSVFVQQYGENDSENLGRQPEVTTKFNLLPPVTTEATSLDSLIPEEVFEQEDNDFNYGKGGSASQNIIASGNNLESSGYGLKITENQNQLLQLQNSKSVNPSIHQNFLSTTSPVGITSEGQYSTTASPNVYQTSSYLSSSYGTQGVSGQNLPQTIISVGTVAKALSENKNGQNIFGSHNEGIHNEVGDFVTAVVNGNGRGRINVGSKGSSSIDFEVNSFGQRERGREQKYHSNLNTISANLPATNKYEEYEIENVKNVEIGKDGVDSSKTTLDLNNLKLEKDKKTVIVVSQVSDANPLLFGKLAGECGCDSNELSYKNKENQPNILTQTPRSRGQQRFGDQKNNFGDNDTNGGDRSGARYSSPSTYRGSKTYDVQEITSDGSTPPTLINRGSKTYGSQLPNEGAQSAVSSTTIYPENGSPSGLYNSQLDGSSPGSLNTKTKPFRGKARYFVPGPFPNDVDYDGYGGAQTRHEIGYHGRAYPGAAYDRYGPGGWRGYDETLQGSVDCKRPGLFRHPKYCNKFYACNYDPWEEKFTLHVFNCPIRLTYDSSIGACNWPVSGPACADDNLLV